MAVTRADEGITDEAFAFDAGDGAMMIPCFELGFGDGEYRSEGGCDGVFMNGDEGRFGGGGGEALERANILTDITPI